ncbi:MAG: hypothetical protein H5T73_00980 [Actinobacteria bacterium]|nr:hypothetical protein [Actinomycetota bacterium]
MPDTLELGSTYGEGDAPGRRQVRLFDLQGNHYEMGYQQGLQMREAVRHYFANITRNEFFNRGKPALLPARLYLSIRAHRAAREMERDLADHCPRQKMRMEGISKGSGIDEVMLYVPLAAETVMAGIDYRIGACTAAAVGEERSALREVLVIKNYDYPAAFQPYFMTRLCRSAETYSTIDVTMATMAGCHDGMNEHGLCVSYNHGYGTDIPSVNVPVSVLVQEALETCANVEEAAELLCSRRRSGGALILLADATGKTLAVELSPNFCGVREAEEGILVATNHYRCREMISYDVPRNAYYTSRNVQALRGVRVHESSELRYARAVQLLSALETVTIKDLWSVFSDHGESGRGDDNTICRHGPYFATTCSLIMLPRSRRLLVTYGHPCESTFSDFPDPFGARAEGGEGEVESEA